MRRVFAGGGGCPLRDGSGLDCPPPLASGFLRGAGIRIVKGILSSRSGSCGGVVTTAAASSIANKIAAWIRREKIPDEIVLIPILHTLPKCTRDAVEIPTLNV